MNLLRPRGRAERRTGPGGLVLRLATLSLVVLAATGCEKRVVNVIPVVGLGVSPSQLTLLEGENRTLQVTVRGPEGESLRGRELSWSSNPSGIVSLTQEGVLNALLPGVTTVTVSTEDVEASVPVTVLAGPMLSLSSTAFNLSAPSGQADAVIRIVDVSNTGNGSLTALSRSVVMTSGAGAGWLTASLSGTSTPAELTIMASAANLPEGNYQGSVTVSDPSARNGAQAVSIDLEVGEALPVIVVDPDAVLFSANAGTVQAATQDVTVTNGGGGSITGLNAQVSPAGAAAWLSAAFTGGVDAPTTLELTASAAALAPGNYAATVTMTSSSAADPATIQVTFQVS